MEKLDQLLTIVVFQRWFLEVLILSVFWLIQGFAPWCMNVTAEACRR